MINKTQRTTFEKDLQNTWKNNRRFYSKRVPEVTDNQILREIQTGKAKVRKSLPRKESYYRNSIEKFFIVPALETKRKREEQETENANKRARTYDLAYYKACDAIAKTESHITAAKIVEDFRNLLKKD